MTSTTDCDICSADGDDIELVAGRGELPWTQIHDWITLSGIPAESVFAYVVLKMHLNRQTGRVNPGTVRLAAILGMARSDKVARAIRPLVAIGAVEVQPYGMPRRNRYIVHSIPKKDYTGPVSLGQWAKIHESELVDERDRQAQKAERMRNRRSAPVPPESGVQEDEGTQNTRSAPVPLISGVQVPPKSGGHVPPKSGVEPDVVQPDVVEPDVAPPPPSSMAPGTPDGTEPQEEEATDDTENLTRTARSVLRHATTGLPTRRFPNRKQAETLVMLVVAALRAGWCPTDLAGHIGDGDLSSVTSVYAVLHHRLTNLGDAPELAVPMSLPGGGQARTRSVADTEADGFDWRTHAPHKTAASEQAKAQIHAHLRARRRADRSDAAVRGL